MNLFRRRHVSLLLIILVTASTLSFAVTTSPTEAQTVMSDSISTSTGYNFVSLLDLPSHYAVLRGTSVATIGRVEFSPSIYQFEDFWLKGQDNTAIPVVTRLAGLPLPQNESLVKVVGTVEYSDLEGGFYYLNASSVTIEKNVILLGWDGVQRNHLLELMGRGLMPNLVSFVNKGTIVNITVSDHLTDTKAGWTQVLTGYKWWRTGVFANSVWFHSIPYGYTIPERLENIYGKDEIATAFITGKLNQMETVNETGTAASGSPFAVYSNEAIYSNLPSQLDVVSVGDPDQDRSADVVGPLTLQFLGNNANNHFFAFFHFSDPDHLGHSYGENSVQYEQGIETCDYWLGQILNELNTLGIAKNTLIYMTNDHGFDEGAFWHSNAPYIVLATNDKSVIRDGDEVDVAPTVYYGLGLWNYSFNPALDGFPLQINLSSSEVQHRQATLADTNNMPYPTMSVTDNGMGQKIVTFNASDDNLAAVLLVIDGKLKTDGPWTWNKTNGIVNAYGSYNINTTNLAAGSHTVQILAYDEHGANNGGPDSKSENGGGAAIKSMDVVVPVAAPGVIPEFPVAFLCLFLFVAITGGLLVLKRKTKSLQFSPTV